MDNEKEGRQDSEIARSRDEESASHSEPLVILKRFRDLPEAFVAKSILDSAQIDSFLADENIVRMDWLYSNLVGGAKLMVRPKDFDEALAVLKESEEASDENETEEGNRAYEPGETGK